MKFPRSAARTALETWVAGTASPAMTERAVSDALHKSYKLRSFSGQKARRLRPSVKGCALLKLSAGLALLLLSGSAQALELKSDDIKPGATIADTQVLNVYGCTGGNVSPEFSWSGAPSGTKSFALMMFDSDAPTGHGFLHWLVFDIPADVSMLARGAGDPGGSLPQGASQTLNDFGDLGYGGPCPPQGDKPHRYHFTIYALKVEKLDAGANASASQVVAKLLKATIAKAEFIALRGQ